ncbi:helix-turn-helix domain-containing protein [Natrarchaeobaculum sulfurireducens]|uniref:Bacterio-opsin activator domain-containing protein n=1 Tax=Natrarchaeobaculum sulfurireducens TaxID=2044521 RepID=A0A346PMZ0_9EURY|nr:helix-turn-helix domain-containing protein [Natrarchaeobaculum sulfurireducens]AXR79087.1 Transcriptional regulator, contains HTH domain [Natrarchaeobaculum sulfurireducens]AXR80885.1 Bacterio-opsin activator domain-containing protein [Natrarchaeobaculum sulfurireducens]
MALTAEFRLFIEQHPLITIAQAVPECTITVEHEDQADAGPIVFVLRVVCGSFEAFETALDAEPAVTEHTLISDDGSVRVYHTVIEDLYPEGIDELVFNKTVVERWWITSDGEHLKQQFATREELLAYRDSCRKLGIDFQLRRLYESNGDDYRIPGVSEKQHEALRVAYEEGYFDVPRRASLREVADVLEISRSALAERLHRGQSHVFEHYFSDRPY